MKVISFANQKGGVGKTAITAHTAYELAQKGKRVLTVDLDPQFNLTDTFDSVSDEPESGLNLLFRTKPEPTKDQIVSVEDWGVDLLPNNIFFSQTLLNLHTVLYKENLLKRALAQVASQYDYCLLDCPPALGDMLINAFAASNIILVPVGASIHSVTGFSQLTETLANVQTLPDLQVRVFWNKYNSSESRVNRNIDSILAGAQLESLVMDTRIRKTVEFEHATGDQKPVSVYSPNSHASEDIKRFADELLNLG